MSCFTCGWDCCDTCYASPLCGRWAEADAERTLLGETDMYQVLNFNFIPGIYSPAHIYSRGRFRDKCSNVDKV